MTVANLAVYSRSCSCVKGSALTLPCVRTQLKVPTMSMMMFVMTTKIIKMSSYAPVLKSGKNALEQKK